MLFRRLLFRPFSTETEGVARKFIDQFVKEHGVALFMKGTPSQPMCGFSRAVCQILQLNGVRDIAAVNVLEDDAVRSEIKRYSNWPTIPQVYVKGDFVGGCDIMMEMHKNGELERLLKEKGILSNTENDDNTPSS